LFLNVTLILKKKIQIMKLEGCVTKMLRCTLQCKTLIDDSPADLDKDGAQRLLDNPPFVYNMRCCFYMRETPPFLWSKDNCHKIIVLGFAIIVWKSSNLMPSFFQKVVVCHEGTCRSTNTEFCFVFFFLIWLVISNKRVWEELN